MTKVAYLGDVHFGARNSSTQFIEYQRKFFENQFIPYLIENEIKLVIQFGDLFDKRTSINTRALYCAHNMFFKPLKKHGIELKVILGNHDIFYLESLEINSPELLLMGYDNVMVYREPTEILVDAVAIDLIPWICKENVDQVNKFMKESYSDYCIGHFEIAGFPHYRGHVSEGGLSPSVFKKYKNVWSGHFHTRSTNGNISYIGTPMEITWQDSDDPRGFEVFDTDTLKTQFVKNNYTLFHKVIYNDQLDTQYFNFDELKEKYVKVVIEGKTNPSKYNSFIQRIFDIGAYDVSIVENFQDYFGGEVQETVKLENTMDVVYSYIDSIEINSEKEDLKSLMQRTYTEAMNVTI